MPLFGLGQGRMVGEDPVAGRETCPLLEKEVMGQ